MTQKAASYSSYSRPAEAGRHQRIVLSWPNSGVAYYDELQGGRAAATATISAIAEAVSRFEPVRLLVKAEQKEEAGAKFATSTSKGKHGIEAHTVATGAPDMWMRDIAPTFTSSSDGVLHGVDFNFNGWGGKIGEEKSYRLAESLLKDLNIPRIHSSIVAEGGAIEVDGQGTLLASESSILNDNRNPGKTRAQIEDELSRTLGVQKIIWVPGAKGLDSTDFHIDAVARFAAPGVVIFAQPRDGAGDGSKEDAEWIEAHREARRILAAATDAQGRPLEIIDVLEPRLELVVPDEAERALLAEQKSEGFRPVFSYVNYLLVEGGVVFPQFGDREADAAAVAMAQRAFPDREVVPVNARGLGVFGGGIHCVSQEVPLL